jgi:hypothetical protein
MTDREDPCFPCVSVAHRLPTNGGLTVAVLGPVLVAAFFLFLAGSLPRLAGAEESLETAPIDLGLYGELLEKHTRSVPDVVGTRVDYAALADSSDWKRLAAQVHRARPSTLDRDGDQQLAFWINAYNILTIELITQNYPVDSIKDLGSFFSPVWDKTVVTLEGRALSLGFIEHEILRKRAEPRIHAAIVCASTSCPPLARTPFRASHLDQDLDNAMRAWLASPKKGIALQRSQNRVTLSRIFDWFSEDFEDAGGALQFAAQYISPEDGRWLRNEGKKARVDFFDYDWSLNAIR